MIAAAAAAMAFAIVVGENKPANDDAQTLQYADDDAAAMTELLEEAGVKVAMLTTFDADSSRRATRKPDGPATKASLVSSLSSMRRQVAAAKAAGSSTTFYFVFSGHGGIRAGEGYLTLEDGRLTRPELTDAFVAAPFADVTHVILDACDSGFMVYPKGSSRRQPTPGPLLQEPAASVGMVFSTSSARDSHEWARFQGGIFSVEVRAALRGAADVDGDGRVTYPELGAFLDRANAALTTIQYAPNPYLRGPQGDGAVLSWAGGDTLTIDVPNAGHIFVEDADANRIVDVNAAPSWTPVVHLPPSRPLFVRTVATNEERRVDEKGSFALSALRPQRGPSPPKGANDAQFERLFSDVLGPNHVRAWVPPKPPEVAPDPFATIGVAGVGVGAVVLLGAALSNAAAQNIHDEGLDKPNLERQARNEQIDALNIVTRITLSTGVAVVGVGVGALAWRQFHDTE